MTLRRKCNDTPNEETISWSFGGIEGYQFAGTGPNRIQTFADTTIANRYFPSLYYTFVQPLLMNDRPINKKKGEGKRFLTPGEELVLDDPIPMVSNIEAGTNAYGVTWDYVPDLKKIHNFLESPPSKLRAWLVNQPDGANVHYWYGIKSNPFLVDTWSQGLNTLSFIPTKLSSVDHSFDTKIRDDGYDLPSSIVDIKFDTIRTKSFRVEESDWYRRGCYRDVERIISINGVFTNVKRRFIICCDVEHNFYAFPVLARNKEKTSDFLSYGSKYGSVPIEYCRKIKYAWPSPIDASTIGKNTNSLGCTQQRPDWNFNHAGTSAVCIVFLYTQWNENGIESERYSTEVGQWIPVYEKEPMLVEINFDITLTGGELNDFTFNITNGRIYDPTTTGRSIISADYAVRDFDEFSIKADDLIILEYVMKITDMTVSFYNESVLRVYRQNVISGYGVPDQYEDYVAYPNDYYVSPYLGGDGRKRYLEYGAINHNYLLQNYNYILHTDFTLSGDRLYNPNLATIAQVKNVGKNEIDGEVIKSWLAHYSSHQTESCSNPLLYLPNKYNMVDYASQCAKFKDTSLKMNDFFSSLDIYTYGNFIKPDYSLFYSLTDDNLKEENKYADFSYVASIQSLELSTLTYLISASLSVNGEQYISSLAIIDHPKKRIESISGTINVLTAFGKEEERIFGGNSIVRSQLELMYDQNTQFPDVSYYKTFDLTCKISSGPTSLDNSATYDSLQAFIIYFNEDTGTATWGTTSGSAYLGYIEKYYRRNKEVIVFEKSTNVDVQNIIIQYKDEVHVMNKTFGCLNVLFATESVVDNFRIKDRLNITGQKFHIYSPSIFTFFDGAHKIIRPGIIAFSYKERTNEPATQEQPIFYNADSTIENYIETIQKGSYSYSGYPYGKVYFNRVYTLTTNQLNNIQNKVITHPNGSFSVFSSPIIVPKDKISIDINDGNFTVNKGLSQSDKDQLFIDRIHYVYEYNNKKTNSIDTFYTDTTHIEMFNRAFNKTYTKEDYNIHYSSIGDTYGNINRFAVSYSGGMDITKTWLNPSLEDSINMLNTSTIGNIYGCNLANPMSYSLLIENTTKMLYIERNISESEIMKSVYYVSYSMNDNYNLYYQPTARLESLFFVKNPYINRDEND